MPRATVAFTDGRGRLHGSAKDAALSDLAVLFPQLKGVASSIASTILDNRAAIERIFAEFDDISGNTPSDGKG